jgi:GNAT superfamily N-acetyltransferase
VTLFTRKRQKNYVSLHSLCDIIFLTENNNYQMTGTFLLELWNTILPAEHRHLLKFLESPVHNQRADVQALAQLLLQTPNPERLDKRLAFEAIYPGQPFDPLRLNHLCSFLVQRLEAFLAWKECTDDAAGHDLLLCRALRRRGAGAHFMRRAERLARDLEQQPQRNAAYHLNRYLLERERYEYRVLHERESPTLFSSVTEPLNHFFMLENLRWAGTGLSLQARYGATNLLPFAGGVLEQAEHADPDRHPELAMMRLGYQTLSDVENEENFRRLKTLLSEKGELFSPSENRDLHLLAINFCLRRHNRGERPAYTREALDLYRSALDKGLLLENGLLQKFTFNNILRLACIAGERDWAGQFLEQHQCYLPPDDRANTYRFNRACWHYLGGEYARVPGLLQTFDFSDRDTQLSARQMLLRSYFELEEWQTLDSLLKSFYTFLRRRHDIGYQRAMYLNLIKYTRKLMSGPLPRRKTEALAGRIRAEPYLAEREWLLAKVSG